MHYIEYMKYISRTLALVVFTVSCAVIVHASPVGRTYTLHTIQSFTELLIGKGIIPQGVADTARTYANMISRVDRAPAEPTKALNADKVVVSVSQLIDQANLEFAPGKDIKGPLLMVKNTTAEGVTLEAKRHCQIVYRIYTDDSLMYDSVSTEKCSTNEQITYMLGAGKVRMFPIMHKATDYALASGTYRFELEYPGYGKGEVTVTVR